MSEWLDLLRAEKAKGRSNAAIARDLGYARTSVALLFSGNYPKLNADGTPHAPRIAEKVMQVYGGPVACPHLGREIERAQCAEMRDAPMPTSSPDRLRHWTACRTCQRNTGARKPATTRSRKA